MTRKHFFTVLLLMFICAPLYAQFEPVRTGVQFVEGGGAVNTILSGMGGACIPRVPTWALTHGGEARVNINAPALFTDCRESLIDAVREFSDVEKNALVKYAVIIDSVIDAEMPALNTFPWSFAVISDSAGFGVPQSRDHIVLTKGLLEEMTEWINRSSRMQFIALEILVREKIRLLQMRYESQFENFYRTAWGFRKVDEFSISEDEMQEHDFYFPPNPSNVWLMTLSQGRSRREYIMPALLLRGSASGGAAITQRVAIMFDSTATGIVPRRGRHAPVEYRDLRLFATYRRMFMLSDYDHHPEELAADLLAKYIVMRYVSANYGTAPTRVSNYSQIDALLRLFGNID